MSDYQDKDYEEVCILCHRPESKAGRMFHLPNNITVCDDCMHKTMETMSHMDMNGVFPGMGMGMVPPQYTQTTSKKEAEVKTDQKDICEEKAEEDQISVLDDEDILNGEEAVEDDVEDIEEENEEEKPRGNGFPFGGFPNISFVNLSDLQEGFGGSSRTRVKKKKKNSKPIIELKDIPAPHKIKEQLDEYVIGQEYAKKVISVAVYNHYKRVATKTMDQIEIEKSNMLMIGPTGSGKTYLVKTLAKILNVPLAIADATSLTEAGYIGDDIESVISKLLAAADNDVERAEHGIIFIDEIDKIAVHGESHGQGVSREGVQRDILPIVEGSNVNTKYGVINTTHILFIAAGAFSVSAPSDLIPELQGRFPLRVELDSLHKEDFKKILQEPKNSLIGQYTALLSTEGVTLNFTEDAIDKMSFIAEDVNARAENIGARRLHTIMEKVLDEISYSADEHSGETINVDAKYVEERLNDIVQDQDLSRYIL